MSVLRVRELEREEARERSVRERVEQKRLAIRFISPEAPFESKYVVNMDIFY